MIRENRYLVLKRSDIAKYLGEHDIDVLGQIADAVCECRAADGKPPVECVVVEHDWPEYEAVWAMLAARVDGVPRYVAGMQQFKDYGSSEHAPQRPLSADGGESTAQSSAVACPTDKEKP